MADRKVKEIEFGLLNDGDVFVYQADTYRKESFRSASILDDAENSTARTFFPETLVIIENTSAS